MDGELWHLSVLFVVSTFLCDGMETVMFNNLC